ncbi:hypothetical protein FQR65_LT03923 [Abscondita terminalis]|nr:hypothetical protein FQR65_LT03923 [Abscondita terminalis]
MYSHYVKISERENLQAVLEHPSRINNGDELRFSDAQNRPNHLNAAGEMFSLVLLQYERPLKVLEQKSLVLGLSENLTGCPQSPHICPQSEKERSTRQNTLALLWPCIRILSSTKEHLRQVQTKTEYGLTVRIPVNDLVAAEARYHSSCLLKTRKIVRILREVVSLLLTRYTSLAEITGEIITASFEFKEKLKCALAREDDDMIQCFKSTEDPNDFRFITHAALVLIGGEIQTNRFVSFVESQKPQMLETEILSMTQDIIYAAGKGSTAKYIALAFAQKLVTPFHQAGHYLSYRQALQIHASLPMVQSSDTPKGTSVPNLRSFDEAETSLVHITADNINIQMEKILFTQPKW